jgi:4-alpha-glucanotransferase
VGVRPHHGINLPLFSLHTRRSPIGEYPDLCRVIDWCRSVGFDTLQLLPLNDTGTETSPYSARSAFALNPIYLQLDALPHMDPSLRDAARMAPQSAMRLDYAPLRTHKRRFLESYCDRVSEQIRSTEGYKQFVEENSWLDNYGLYKVLKAEMQGLHWEEWPEEWRQPSRPLLEQFRSQIQTHILTQYLCHQQLKLVRDYAEQAGILLMGDIPILIDRDSADVWAHRDYFKMGADAGAPPDALGPEGQDWGFPPYDWNQLAMSNYGWWRQRLQVASGYYHLVRIDHIVGFFRIWTIPRGLPSSQGHFEPADATLWEEHGRKLLQMMIDASSLLPIGEDLGTVPNSTRTCMEELGICGTRVMRWEKDWSQGHYLPLNCYDPLSLTTVSTHDTEPLALWYQTDPSARLLAPSPKALLEASHQTSSLFHINLLNEYLTCFQELSWDDPAFDRINSPGTVSSSNWTARLRPSLEEWTHSSSLCDWLQKISQV